MSHVNGPSELNPATEQEINNWVIVIRSGLLGEEPGGHRFFHLLSVSFGRGGRHARQRVLFILLFLFLPPMGLVQREVGLR